MEVNLGALDSHWFRFGFALVSLWFRFGFALGVRWSWSLEPGACIGSFWTLGLDRFWMGFDPFGVGLIIFFSSRHLTF